MSAAFEIQLISVFVAAACALPGVFLVLRSMSMMSDSITHTILLGIVPAFFLTRDLSSPLLILGAAAMGVLTVWLTELLNRTRLLSEDASIGIVFPLLFSLAIILITRYAGSVHLDTDSVLLGELAFAPFDRLVLFGRDLGAKALYLTGGMLLLNLAVIGVLVKEFQLATFDPLLAAVLGFAPGAVHYGLMTLVSVTAVGAFQSAGSVLVVAFMIGPPVTARLLTDNLKHMLLLSGLLGALSGVLGYQAAAALDVSIAGSMAVMTGLIFLSVFVFAPRKGLLSSLHRKMRRKVPFAELSLLLHLARLPEAGGPEMTQDRLRECLGWSRARVRQILAPLLRAGWVEAAGENLAVTGPGREHCARQAEALLGE